MAMPRLLKCSINSGGATAQPIRQPVMACDFDRLDTVTVRSAMPSMDAIEVWRPSNTSSE